MAEDDEIRAHEMRRCDALVARDRAALDALFSDDFVYVHSSGRKEGKGTYVDSMVATANPFLGFTHRELEVERLGDAALATGVVEVRRKDNTVVFLFAEVWVRGAGGWRLRYQQNTKAAG